ncbi:hypothetical protein MMC31_003649 [Peltigera leucophlebia]|nr:hypothetical protein [Peltigera leucophlebia]
MFNSNGSDLKLGLKILVLGAVFTLIAIVAVILRLWSRQLKRQEMALNDWAAIAALFTCCCLSAVVIEMVVASGMGQYLKDLKNPEEQLEKLIKSLFALHCLWAISNALVKISICHLYVQIFRLRSLRIAAYTIMVAGVAYCVAVILEAFLLCKPIRYSWDKNIDGHCGNAFAAYLSVAIVDLITELSIILLPMPYVWTLQLPVGKKIALTCIFGLGIIICVFSVLRVHTLVRWEFEDLSYSIGNLAIYSLLEPILGLVGCCLMVLQPVISKLTMSRIWSVERIQMSDPKESLSHEPSRSHLLLPI